MIKFFFYVRFGAGSSHLLKHQNGAARRHFVTLFLLSDVGNAQTQRKLQRKLQRKMRRQAPAQVLLQTVAPAMVVPAPASAVAGAHSHAHVTMAR